MSEVSNDAIGKRLNGCRLASRLPQESDMKSNIKSNKSSHSANNSGASFTIDALIGNRDSVSQLHRDSNRLPLINPINYQPLLADELCQSSYQQLLALQSISDNNYQNQPSHPNGKRPLISYHHCPDDSPISDGMFCCQNGGGDCRKCRYQADFDKNDCRNQSRLRHAYYHANYSIGTFESLHKSKNAAAVNGKGWMRKAIPVSQNVGTSLPKYMFGPYMKEKRFRTTFTPQQLIKLEEIFAQKAYVVGIERKQLASELNLGETQIKVWFQNRRTKQKRDRLEQLHRQVLH